MELGLHRLQDRVALVTGATSGIGEAIAKSLLKAGCRVALLGRDPEKLDRAKQECLESAQSNSDKTMTVNFDLGDRSADLKSAIDQVVQNFGALDILVNAAGVGKSSKGVEEGRIDLHGWDEMLDTNLRAPMHLTVLALPEIIKRVETGPNAKCSAIINIVSVAGLQSLGGSAGYVGSKFGLRGFTGSVFEDAKEKGVKICAINPGYVATKMVAHHDADMSKMIQPEEIAKTVVFVCSFPETSCITEVTIKPQHNPMNK
eukprot:GILK01016141.1.p1 GENE.GILK01016141.1~~GILK01016141.1.p1  ORF type:complete len:275 (-),score=35.31 GILK01016141.1:96-872(-)